jgi:hypothetical protein
VDYGRLTGLLAADIDPDRIAAGRTGTPRTATPATEAVRVDDADKPQPKPRPASVRKSVAKPDASTRVRAAIAAHPDATRADIARLAKTTDRTVRRVLSAVRDDTVSAPRDGAVSVPAGVLPPMAELV